MRDETNLRDPYVYLQLGLLFSSSVLFGLATRFPSLWWMGMLAPVGLALFLAQPVSKDSRWRFLFRLSLGLIAFRFLWHVSLNYWVYQGYPVLVHAGVIQTFLVCSLYLLIVSFVALGPAAVQVFRDRSDSPFWRFALVFLSLMLWEHVAVVFPLSPFVLFSNSEAALGLVARWGLETLRVLLMLTASSIAVLWWSRRRKWALLPVLLFPSTLLVAANFGIKDRGCANCAQNLPDADLIQLYDGQNGGPNMKGAAEKIPWIQSMAKKENLTWTIWPEGAFDDVDSQTEAFEKVISTLSLEKNRIHFFGAIRRTSQHSIPSLFVVDSTGLIAERGKTHPFPVGEWSPFPDHFSSFGLVSDKARLIRSAEPSKPLMLDSSPDFAIVTFICADALSEWNVRKLIREARATGKTPIVIQLFNDFWFNGTQEPFQHSLVVRLWAAEFGVYWLRAGMTGETEVINPEGRILAKTDPLKRQILSIRNQGCDPTKPGCLLVEKTEHSE